MHRKNKVNEIWALQNGELVEIDDEPTEGITVSADDFGGNIRDVVDIYLHWNGVIGYTDRIYGIWEDTGSIDKVKAYCDYEGIGDLYDLDDALRGEVYISDMDQDDFAKLKRQLGIYESVRKPMRRRLKENEIRRYSDVVPYEKRRYWYWTKHGLGPGTLPKGVNVLDAKEGQNQKGTWGVFVLLDAVLNSSELREYDLIELAPKEVNESIPSYYDGQVYVCVDNRGMTVDEFSSYGEAQDFAKENKTVKEIITHDDSVPAKWHTLKKVNESKKLCEYDEDDDYKEDTPRCKRVERFLDRIDIFDLGFPLVRERDGVVEVEFPDAEVTEDDINKIKRNAKEILGIDVDTDADGDYFTFYFALTESHKSRNKRLTEDSGKRYEQTITISPKVAERIEYWLSDNSDDRLTEDDTYTETASFPDGMEVDVKCCGSDEDTAWTEAILFHNGYEVTFTEPEDEYFGDWELEDDSAGNTYVVHVVKGVSESQKSAKGKKLTEGKLVEPPIEDIEFFENYITDTLGYNIEAKGKTWFGNNHYQIRSINRGNTREDLKLFARDLNQLDELMEKREIPMTYNAGIDDNGYITAGLDLNKKYIPDETDVPLEQSHRYTKLFVDNTDEALKESRQLNEGPGAGYFISGEVGSVGMDNITISVDDETDNAIYYKVDGDISLYLTDVVVESYYYGGEIPEAAVKVDNLVVSAERDWELPAPTEEDVYDLLESLKFKAVYGGGWSHSTFDGNLELSYENSNYYSSACDLEKMEIHFTDQTVIDVIDKYSTGENYTTEYRTDDGEYFETKEEAIKYAEENDCDFVEEVREFWSYDGEENYDYEDTDLVGKVWVNPKTEGAYDGEVL